jgi:hypothetical protein
LKSRRNVRVCYKCEISAAALAKLIAKKKASISPGAFMSHRSNLYFFYISPRSDRSGFFMALPAILRWRGRYRLRGEIASWLLLAIARF